MEVNAWIQVLRDDPALFYGATLLLGLIVGSFLNVVILRLPRMLEEEWRLDCAALDEQLGEPAEDTRPRLSLSSPPSTCPECGHRIRAYENIPVLSYLALRGRCSACGAKISPRYPLIEAATGILSLLVAIEFGVAWQAAAALVLTWALIALAMIDFDTQLLPDRITQPLLWLGLILSLFGLFTDPRSSILGAVFGYLTLWSVFHLFRLVTGKEGMGYGDFKLLALFGAWFGWQSLPQVILLSAVTGAIVGVLMMLLGRHERGTPMPFGPFLAMAGWICLVWGGEINALYLSASGLG